MPATYKDSSYVIKNRVGTVLIIFGIIDLILMILSIVKGWNYSSSLNIISIIAGIFLVRGKLKTVKVVSFFSSLFLTLICAFPLIIINTIPFDFIPVFIKLNKVTVLLGIGFYFLPLFLMYWVYRNLTSEPVLDDLIAAGLYHKRNDQRPKLGFWVGVGSLTFFGLFFSMVGIDDRSEAVNRAKTKMGEEYKYFVSSYSLSSNSTGYTEIETLVIAYNKNEIHELEISWTEE